MYELYQQDIPLQKLRESRKQLKLLYEAIPETSGCLENIAKEDGCKAWCCSVMTPQVTYAEFLNTWNHITHTWSASQVVDLIMRTVRAYLDPNPTKGCVFWDKEKFTCAQHSTRPYNCRTYSQIPAEEFKPRFERLKLFYAGHPDAVVKDQCGLTETLGKKPTVEDMNQWFEELKLIESDLGVTQVHDGDGGYYRVYHDHILLKIGSPDFLWKLTKIRVNGSAEDKEKFVNKMEDMLRDRLTKPTSRVVL